MANKEEANGQDQARRMIINAQYVKDFSFENPNAPKSLMITKAQPQMELNVDVQAQKLQEHTFEVALVIQASAKNDDGPMFVAELNYAGIFTIEGIEGDELQFVLLTRCPDILFPFARRVVADATRDGGFPPLMLEPIDFIRLYEQRRGQDAAKDEKKTANA